MSNYDFSTLSPIDFEALAHDIVSKDTNIRFRAFTSGRDGGIDLRHSTALNGNAIVVQCKHYPNKPFSALFNSLRNEVSKVAKLKPSRYLVVTSCKLTPQNVTAIKDLFAPYCQSENDIYSCSDINSLLGQHSDIEKKHQKLWISSTAILEQLIHSDVFAKTALTVELAKKRLSLLVPTRLLLESRKMLEANRICILCGNPGVGKTTTAEMLLVEHIRNGWEPIVATQNINEALRLFRHGGNKRQIIYYDDFLGQISSEQKLEKNEDATILSLFEAIQQSNNKRFLLTTREYILTQAKHFSEKLFRSNIDIFKFTISCDEYSLREKAEILANHLYFNSVPTESIKQLLDDRQYQRIVEHPNYNPRLVESATKPLALSGGSFVDAFVSLLDDPRAHWEHSFHNQLSPRAATCLLAVGFLGDHVLMDDLEKVFVRLSGLRASPSSRHDFEQALNELENTYLRIQNHRNEKTKLISAANPSVLDFIKSIVQADSQLADQALDCCIYFRQIKQLMGTLEMAEVLLSRREGQFITTIKSTLSQSADEFCFVQQVDGTKALRAANSPIATRLELLAKYAVKYKLQSIKDLFVRLTTEFFSESALLADAAVVSLLSQLELDGFRSLVPKPTRLDWKDRVRASFSSERIDELDDIDEFREVLDWLCNDSGASAQDISQYQESAESWIHSYFEGLDTRSEAAWALEALDELETHLKLDLSYYKTWFEKDHSETSEEGYEEHYNRRLSQDVSYDDIFDSLRGST